MRARDQFHVGIVTTDIDATTAALSATLGYEWGRTIDSTIEASGQLVDRRAEAGLRTCWTPAS
ncbi:hypothetical protein [Nocardia sp. NPDC003345]